MNNKQKGTKMEALCLKEYKAYMQRHYTYRTFLAEWRTINTSKKVNGGKWIANNNDFLNDWDLALLEHDDIVKMLTLIQVKSKMDYKLLTELHDKYKNLGISVHGYLAVYRSHPKTAVAFKLPSFDVVEVF